MANGWVFLMLAAGFEVLVAAGVVSSSGTSVKLRVRLTSAMQCPLSSVIS